MDLRLDGNAIPVLHLMGTSVADKLFQKFWFIYYLV